MLTQIYNGHILTPEGWINGGSVVIEDTRIKEVSKSTASTCIAMEEEDVTSRSAHHRPS